MRWAGPPRLLIAVTVVGFVVASMVSSPEQDLPPDRAGTARVELSSGDLRQGVPHSVPEVPPRETNVGALENASAKPAEPKPDVVGVVTLNQHFKLSRNDSLQDARAVTSRPGADIVGWQEAYAGTVFASLRARGWDTKRFQRGAKELAISWRRSKFVLVSAEQRRVANGVDEVGGRFPFGDRFLIRVTLRHRENGRLLSVINTHLPRRIEDPDRPGHWESTRNTMRARLQLERLSREWDRAPGRWVVGTGDYNFDAGADARVRVRGGLRQQYDGHAISSYQALGRVGVQPTHPPTGRYIDYVHASQASVRAGHVRFLGQRSISGLNSDHRALLVRFAID